MELAKLFVSALGAIAWPITVLIVILIFKREIVKLLSHIKEARFPGGSLTLELDKLSETIERNPDIKEKRVITEKLNSSQDLLQFGDSFLAIANTRIEIEREILRLMRPSFNLREVRIWSFSKKVSSLANKEIISRDTAERLNDYIRITNKLIHGIELSADEVNRSILIGTSLLSHIRYLTSVENLIFDFKGHGLWHMWLKKDKISKKYYFWSAVAATMPEFDHSYEIYLEAAEKYNSKEYQRTLKSDRIYRELYIVSLKEFVEILKFRRDEIQRVLQGNWWKDNEWHWPDSWGHLGWNCPVFRGSANDAEDELIRINAAIDRYQRKVLEHPELYPENEEV